MVLPVRGAHIGAAAAAIVLFLVIAIADAALKLNLALVIATVALITGIALLRKSRMSEFCPELLAGDVILPRASRARSPKLLLPLQFTNAGHGGGVIQWVALRLTIDGQADRSVLLSPVAEVDMAGFLQAKRQITATNAIDHFTAFTLEGKRAIAKFVLFDISERGRGEPLDLRPGRYRFEVFMKASHAAEPRLERTFEHLLTEKQIEEYRADATVYLINYQITLPAARREMSSGEWLPRAREA
ncbi:MAG TPA: hypothetical protein VM140_11225 [Burkholderiales bacterium]|nr:hypothetical protein [Burkholderiales bacterium]